MDFIDVLISTIAGYWQSSMDWMSNALVEISSYFILLMIEMTYESAIYALSVSAMVANNVITELKFNEFINSYYGRLPPEALQLSSFLALPECINTILSALMIRFVMGRLSFLS